MPASSEPLRMAVLIDAENFPASCWPMVRDLLNRVFPARALAPHAFFCGDHGGWREHGDVVGTDGGAALRAKNSADFLLSFHAGRMVAEGLADEVVLLSGDDGLAVVAQALRDGGLPVYAVIPCGSGTYGCRLASASDVALIAPLPPRAPAPSPAPTLLAVPSGGQEISITRRIAEVIASCVPDEQGWVRMNMVGSALSAHGVNLAGKKLKGFLGTRSAFEMMGAPDSLLVRLRPRTATATARGEAGQGQPAPDERVASASDIETPGTGTPPDAASSDWDDLRASEAQDGEGRQPQRDRGFGDLPDQGVT